MIMQRWTKQARHLLPADLAQYQKHNPALLAQTFRHSSLMLKALRFVEMGDSNVQSHSIAMKILDDGIECLAEVSKVKDGLGLSHNNLESSDPVPECSLVDEFPQRAPKRKREQGRPSNKRDKASHEKLSKRPRFCSACRSNEHTLQRCPNRDPSIKRARRPPTCSGCGISGHTVDRCGKNQAAVHPEIMFL